MRIKVLMAPGKEHGGTDGEFYPWGTMKVGAMFEVVGISRNSIAPQAWKAGKRLKRKFTCKARPGSDSRFVVRRVK